MKIGKKLIIIIPSAVVLCAICAIAGIFFGHQINYDNSQGVVLDNDASSVTETTSPENGSQGIKVPGYADIEIDSGVTNFPITLLNPSGNPCYFKFTLSLDETGEELGTTDYVKPGDAIKGLELSSPLKQGEYILDINIQTKSLDTHEAMNGASVQTKLKVN